MSHHWWTWVAYGVAFLLLAAGHTLWFMATHDPAVASRFGSAVIILGIVVTARPYFRTGLRETVDRQMPGRHLSTQATDARLERQTAAHIIARPGIVHDVVAERIIGVALILFGTLASGYGDLPLKWMGYGAK